MMRITSGWETRDICVYGGRVQRKMPKVRVLCIQQGLKSLESLLVVCASSLAAYVIDVRHFDILGM